MAATLDTGSISTFATGTGASVVVNAPAGAAEGKLILVHVGIEGGDLPSVLESGFSAQLTLDVSGSMHGYIFAKPATDSEPSSYTFTLGASAVAWVAWSELIETPDLSDYPTSTFGGSDTNEADNQPNIVVAGTGLTAALGDLLIGFMVSRGTGATLSSNGGVMTPMSTTQVFGARTALGFYESLEAGAVGSRQFDCSTSTYHTAGLLLLKAAEDAEPENVPPVVTITAPSVGSIAVTAGTLVRLTATATDEEDGDLSDSIEWTSSNTDDGYGGDLGTGAEVDVDTTGWEAGSRTITATVADTETEEGSDSITLTIGEAPPPAGGYLNALAQVAPLGGY